MGTASRLLASRYRWYTSVELHKQASQQNCHCKCATHNLRMEFFFPSIMVKNSL